METQTLEEEIAEAKRDLREAEARYDAAEKKRNPDDPKLDRLLQDKIAATLLLHDLYTEKRLHQEQQARETPAGNVRFLNRTEGMVRWKTEGWHSRTSAKLDILFAVCSQ